MRGERKVLFFSALIVAVLIIFSIYLLMLGREIILFAPEQNFVLNVAPNGLVGYWNFDNGNVNDLSPNLINGVVSPPLTFVPDAGAVSGAILVGDGSGAIGTGGGIDLTTSESSFAFPGAFSIGAWINPANLTGIQTIFARGSTQSGPGEEVYSLLSTIAGA